MDNTPTSNGNNKIDVPIIKNETKSDIETPEKRIQTDVAIGFTGKKALMLRALKARLGIVLTAAEDAQISRQTHMRWLEADPKYKERVEQIMENLKDIGENIFLQLLLEKNPQITMHFAKTKLRERGYGEVSKVEQDINIAHKDGILKVEIVEPKKDEDT